jgi:tRNA (cmo5U34)-methyltransferase
MVVRSIPFYQEQQRMIQELGARLWVPETDVYDLGCATATTLINLREAIGPNARFTGYDNSAPMRERARQKIHARDLGSSISIVHGDLDGHLAELSLANAGLITTEKILAGHGQLNRLFIEAYYDLKRRSGYSDHEIARKREALENVLVPYRIEENRELFLRNGFDAVETFFQWYNFVGFLCMKKSRRGTARATEAMS